MQRLQTIFVGWFLLIIGLDGAQTPAFASVADAVQQLPELSLLNGQVGKISAADKLKDPNFVGTVFAPINSGLQPLLNVMGGDLTKMGTAAQVNDVFSTSVLTTKVLLEQLQDGQTLTSMNGNKVTVSIQMVNGGKVYYINKARITTANILAGQAVIHEVTPILVPSSYQSLLDMLGVKDTAVVPTAVYANPTAPSPVPTTPGGSSSGGASSGSSSSSSSSSPEPSSTVGTSPSPATPAPASSPAPTTISSPAPSSTTSPGSSSPGSPSSAGSTGGAVDDTANKPPTASNSTGSTPSGSTGSTSAGSGNSATPSPSPATTTTPAPGSSLITAENGLKLLNDPNLGASTAGGHTAVLATALLAVPLIVAALL